MIWQNLRKGMGEEKQTIPEGVIMWKYGIAEEPKSPVKDLKNDFYSVEIGGVNKIESCIQRGRFQSSISPI